MESLRELFVTLGLDYDAAGFAQATVAVELLEKAAEVLVDTLKAVPQFLAESVLATAEYGGALDDASKRTGVAAETLQELGFAAAQSGVGTEELQTSLGKLARQMNAASEGSKEALSAFTQLGVKVTNADGTLRSVDDVFAELADRFVEIDNPAKRTALAMEVFGRSGANLLPLLLEGGAGIDAMREAAIDLGLVMSNEAVRAADTFGDSLDALRGFFDSLKRDVGQVLIEGLQPLLSELLEFIKANRELIKTRLREFARGALVVFRALVAVLQQAGRVMAFVVDNWRGFALLLSAVLIPILWSVRAALFEQLVAFALNTAAAIAYGATQVAAGLAAAAAWTAANAPLLLSIALLAVLLLAAEDVWVALEGGDSLIGEIGPKWTAFLDEFTRDLSDNPLVLALQTAIFYLSDLEGRLLPMLKDSWASALLQPITAAIELLFKLFRGTATFVDYLKTIPGLGLVVEQAQRVFSSSAETPEGSAASSVPASSSSTVVAPRFSVGAISVTAAPGQNPEEVAGAVERKLEDFHQRKLDELLTQTGG